MPGTALGAPSFFVPVMRTALASWERVEFFNTVPRRNRDATPVPRRASRFEVQRAFRRRCAGRAEIAARLRRGGRATQRLWLTATRLGFQMQPLYTPLVFSKYARRTATSRRSNRRRRGRSRWPSGSRRSSVPTSRNGPCFSGASADEERQGSIYPETTFATDCYDGA